jgi:CHAT domain-containing protein/Tfp pilus assembly protein PilF
MGAPELGSGEAKVYNLAMPTAFLGGCGLLCGLLLAGAHGQPRPPLVSPGPPVVVRPSGSRQVYRVRVSAGRLTRLTLEQRDLDVAASLRAPRGGVLATADEFEYGVDSLSFVAEADETIELHVEILAKHSRDASYAIVVEAPREASSGALVRREAEILSTAVKNPPPGRSAGEILEDSRRATSLWAMAANQAGEAASLVRTGDLLYARGALAAARAQYLAALALSRSYHDPANAAEAANDAGYLELQLGETVRSESHLKEALGLWTKLNSPFGRATALNNLGLWSWQTASFGAAARAYKDALPLLDPHDLRSRALLLNNMGLAYLSMGSYRQAIESLSSAVNLFPASERLARSRALMNLGRAYLFSGSWRAAMRFYNRALPLLKGSPDSRPLADLLNNLGQACSAGKDLDEAQRFLEQARGLYIGAADRRGQASADYHLGLIDAKSGNISRSAELLNESIRLREAIGLRDDLAASLLALARVERDHGELAKAQEYAERSLQLIESLRATVPGEFRMAFFSARQPLYEFYVDLLMDRHGKDPAAGFDRLAFEISERARARELMESLREVKTVIRRGAGPALLARERSAQQILNLASQGLSSLLSAVHTTDQEALGRKKLEAARESYGAIEYELREQSPEYASLVWPQPKKAKEIQRGVLDPRTLLLAYSLGEQRSFLWAVTPDSIESFILPGSARLESLAETMIQLAGDYRRRVRDPATARSYHQAARAMSSSLLGPVAARLGRKRLLIVPSGALQRVPFAALFVPGDSAFDAVPLGVRNELTLTPSASALAELRALRRGRPPAPRSVVVLADPVFTSGDPRVSRRSAQGFPGDPAATGIALTRLPFTREEASRVVEFAPPGGTLQALGFDASRTTLMRDDIGRYRFVHLATHYRIDERHPEQSGLVLSLVDREGRPDNGLIRLDDLFAGLPRLACDMVTLSACNSAFGTDVRGEGLIGLGRAFFYAGSSRVLVSLWPCDDPATAEFMGSLYKAMLGGAGQSPAAALRSARQAFWEKGGRWKDPYYWAGFTLYGEYR